MSAQGVPDRASDEDVLGLRDAHAVRSYWRDRDACSSVLVAATTGGRDDHYKCLAPPAEVSTAVALGCPGRRVGSRFEGAANRFRSSTLVDRRRDR
jgi:hypothetical protein